MTDGAGAWCDVAVIERGADPGGGVVAACRVTGCGGGQVDGRLAGSGGTVVAGVTGTRYHLAVVKHRTLPRGGDVAGVTGGTGGDVGNVFASGVNAVVAAIAAAWNGVLVIKLSPEPSRSGVAVVTLGAGDYV